MRSRRRGTLRRLIFNRIGRRSASSMTTTAAAIVATSKRCMSTSMGMPKSVCTLDYTILVKHLIKERGDLLIPLRRWMQPVAAQVLRMSQNLRRMAIDIQQDVAVRRNLLLHGLIPLPHQPLKQEIAAHGDILLDVYSHTSE